jgi:hypothetical protein
MQTKSPTFFFFWDWKLEARAGSLLDQWRTGMQAALHTREHLLQAIPAIRRQSTGTRQHRIQSERLSSLTMARGPHEDSSVSRTIKTLMRFGSKWETSWGQRKEEEKQREGRSAKAGALGESTLTVTRLFFLYSTRKRSWSRSSNLRSFFSRWSYSWSMTSISFNSGSSATSIVFQDRQCTIP